MGRELSWGVGPTTPDPNTSETVSRYTKWEPYLSLWRGKTDKEKSKGIWRSDAPEASQGQTRDVPGTPGTFGPDLCVNQY